MSFERTWGEHPFLLGNSHTYSFPSVLNSSPFCACQEVSRLWLSVICHPSPWHALFYAYSFKLTSNASFRVSENPKGASWDSPWLQALCSGIVSYLNLCRVDPMIICLTNLCTLLNCEPIRGGDDEVFTVGSLLLSIRQAIQYERNQFET